DSDINIEISASKKRSKQTLLRIEISESAAGIETEFAHTIFAEVDKNMLTSDQIVQGGIGINITKQLIEMMGGQIGYSDSAMQGNVFWIEVPLGEAESSREQAANGGRLLGKRVLIISTNEGNRKTVASTMAAWGITTESKASYDLTVTTLHRNIDLGHPFDLLMLDVSSKTSIEEVIEFLKDLNSHHVIKDTKRIILINKITTGDEQIVKELGVLSCLSKPINRKHLKTALEDALTESNYPNEILTEDSKLSSQLTPGDSASVLIIDPAKRYQQTLSAIVSTAGIESNVATSLKEAVKAIETKNYSMVLIDQSMPQMNVDEIVRNIRKAEKKVADKREKTQQGMMKTSIVLIVDELNEKRQRHWHKIGVDDFIGKPISNDDMSELMSRWDLLA
ncbi:MAG: response regulator, partial [Gammaproteobacteria bacterium]|nr:response regulator [Gammaproteobacteria bacterium]